MKIQHAEEVYKISQWRDILLEFHGFLRTRHQSSDNDVVLTMGVRSVRLRVSHASTALEANIADLETCLREFGVDV